MLRHAQVGGIGVNAMAPLSFEMIMETIYGWGNDGAGVRYRTAFLRCCRCCRRRRRYHRRRVAVVVLCGMRLLLVHCLPTRYRLG
jgi:hypothetical protein